MDTNQHDVEIQKWAIAWETVRLQHEAIVRASGYEDRTGVEALAEALVAVKKKLDEAG